MMSQIFKLIRLYLNILTYFIYYYTIELNSPCYNNFYTEKNNNIDLTWDRQFINFLNLTVDIEVQSIKNYYRKKYKIGPYL